MFTLDAIEDRLLSFVEAVLLDKEQEAEALEIDYFDEFFEAIDV